MPNPDTSIDPLKPIKSASPEIQRIIKRVLQLEKERLYEKRPWLKDDIVAVIRQEISDAS